MTEWTSWAVVIRQPATKEEVLAVEGMIDGRDVPLFTGTVGEFAERWRRPFVVHHSGRYFEVGVG